MARIFRKAGRTLQATVALGASVTLLLCCSILFAGESNVKSKNEDTYSIEIVKLLLQRTQGVAVGAIEKQKHRLGDRVSIALIKLLDEEALRNGSEVGRYLPIIREAFSRPQLISHEEDRNPQVTLLLLRYLQAEVNDPTLRQEISDTIKFVKSASEKGK